MIIHYKCTRQFLVFAPYPPSFHEMIVPLIFLLVVVRTGAPGHTKNVIRAYACTNNTHGVFSKTVCTKVFLTGQILSLECADSIYVKTTETTCVSDELCRRRRR